jgi:hypothetical protein
MGGLLVLLFLLWLFLMWCVWLMERKNKVLSLLWSFLWLLVLWLWFFSKLPQWLSEVLALPQWLADGLGFMLVAQICLLLGATG